MGINFVLVGFALILIGVAVLIIGSAAGASAKDTKVAVGGFIGPIPFGFANDPKLMKITIGITVAFFALFLLLPFILRYAKS